MHFLSFMKFKVIFCIGITNYQLQLLLVIWMFCPNFWDLFNTIDKSCEFFHFLLMRFSPSTEEFNYISATTTCGTALRRWRIINDTFLSGFRNRLSVSFIYSATDITPFEESFSVMLFWRTKIRAILLCEGEACCILTQARACEARKRFHAYLRVRLSR